MATYNNIKKIKIGDNIFNLYDSGGTITSVKTTAGAHSAIDVTSGAVSFNVPTKTSHLTNDSGFVTTDEKVKVTALNSSDTYYPILASGIGTDVRQIATTGVSFKNSGGGSTLSLGLDSNHWGVLKIGGESAYSVTVENIDITANRSITLPDKSGTVALTSDIPTISYPVTSVNSKTGAVSLTASDVGAIRGNVGGVFFGTCSTEAGTVAKVVDCADFTANDLKAGTIIIVSFAETNSGAGASLTMNVNSTGAKPIKYINNGTLGNIYSSGYLKANTEYPFYYDGANWVVLFNVNTTYSNISETDMKAGTATTGRLITAAMLKAAVKYHAPVTSVNGSTGAVTISVPTKTSELTNDSGFINTSTAIPTANTVSKFDSSAHMNSSDMSSQDITSFVNALDTQGTNLVDYVVGTGVDGIWTYRKWASGLYDAWYEGDVNLLAGTAWGSGFYWHQSSSALDPPSFSQSVTALTGAARSGRLAMFCGFASNYSQYWTTGTSAASSLPVRLDMYGTW